MARYQIRTPEHVILEDVVEQLASGAWKVLSAWHAFDPDCLNTKTFKQFRDAIRETLEPSVKTFKLCGLSNICLDGVKGTPWSVQPHALDAGATDLVYHLYPGADPNEFLRKLSEGAFVPLEGIVKPDLRLQALSTLRVVFREVLGQYLYQNPICGKTELCAYSQGAPEEIWDREERKGQNV